MAAAGEQPVGESFGTKSFGMNGFYLLFRQRWVRVPPRPTGSMAVRLTRKIINKFA